MRILRIRLKNIHSLKGEHEIDFSDGAIAEAGLFAITGPTGSGKSTLLDVITLALFNKIPRMDKSINKNVMEYDGGVMTRYAKDSLAEVDFTVGDQSFRAHWSIERARTNALKQRKQELVDLSSGQIIDAGTKVPDTIASIIGLSYDQFVKAMVLSQGQFSKLLKAPRDERNKLLEDITGAGQYRKIGAKVFEKYSTAKQAVKLQETRLGEIVLLSEEALNQIKEQQKTLSKEEPVLNENYQKLNSLLQIRVDIQQLKVEQQLNNAQNKKHQLALENAKVNRLKLTEHEKLVVHKSALDNNLQLQSKVYELSTSINRTRQSFSQSEEDKNRLLKEISELIAQPLEKDKEKEQLESFRSSIEMMLQQEQSDLELINSLKILVKSNATNISRMGVEIDYSEIPEVFLATLNNALTLVQHEIDASGEKDLKAIERRIEALKQKQAPLGELLVSVSGLEEKKNALSEHETTLATGKQKLTDTAQQYKNLLPELEKLETEVKGLKKDREAALLHKSLEEHRMQLVEGEPCPLCGSTHHPYVSDSRVKEVEEDLFHKKQALLDSTSKLLNQLEVSKTLQAEEHKSIQGKIKQLRETIEKLQIQIQADLKKLGLELNSDKQQVKKAGEKLGNQIEILQKSKAAFLARTQIKETIDSVGQWKAKDVIYRQNLSNRKKLYAGKNINVESNALSNKYTEVNESIRQLSLQLNNIEESLKQHQSLLLESDNALKAILKKHGLASVDALKKGILEELVVQQIRAKIYALDKESVRLKEATERIAKALNEKLAKDDTSVEQQQLELAHKAASSKLNELQQQIGKIIEKLENDKQARDKQAEKIKALKLLQKDEALWKKMNDLIGDRAGKRFSNFVQDLTLEQLIGYANKRLEDLTDRYYLDIPTAAEAEKFDSLKIFDKHMGDSRRSVKTLSGGETFIVSLAMAFALSDLAARNVQIESLFIDEGFGTLDPDTLDQAITILEKIQNEGDKSIGVISHVEALKERITTQIKLTKSGAGFSTITIE